MRSLGHLRTLGTLGTDDLDGLLGISDNAWWPRHGQRGASTRRTVQASAPEAVKAPEAPRRKKPDVVLLTPAAIDRLRYLLKKRKESLGAGAGEEQFIRLGVKRRGLQWAGVYVEL